MLCVVISNCVLFPCSYVGYLAEGKYNCSTLDSMEDEAPLKLLPELENDTQQQDDDVVLLKEQRNSREEETEDADVSEVQRNLREQETQADIVVTEKQIRLAAIAKRRQEKQDRKSSKSSRVECLMERYIEMKSKRKFVMYVHCLFCTCSALYLVITGCSPFVGLNPSLNNGTQCFDERNGSWASTRPGSS